MIRKILLSGINFITYLFVGIILIAYGTYLFSSYAGKGLLYWAVALLVLLFMSFLVGFVLSRCFPDRRSSQFSFLFNVIEGVCIMIIFMAGVELSLKGLEGLRFEDEWELVFVTKSLFTKHDLFEIKAVADGFFKQAGLYPTVLLFRIVVPVVQQLLSGFETTEIILKTMLTVHILIGLLTYRCARLLSGRVASISVFAVMMLLPSQMFSPSVLNLYAFGSMWAMAQVWVFLLSRRMARREDVLWIRIVMDFIGAIFGGMAAFCNPVFFLLIPAEILYICLYQKNRSGLNPESHGIRCMHNVILLLGSVSICLSMMFVQAMDMATSFTTVLYGSFESWFLKGDFVRNFLSVWSSEDYVESVIMIGNPFVNSICYGCLIGVAFICLIFCWFLKERDLFVLDVILLGLGVITGLNGTDTVMHIAAIPILAIFAGALFEKVYSALRYQAFRQMKEIEQSANVDSDDDDDDEDDDAVKTVQTEMTTEEAQPAVAEGPAVAEEPVVAEESAVAEEPAVAEVPAETDEPEEPLVLRVDDVIAQNRNNANGEPGIFERQKLSKYDLVIKEFPQFTDDIFSVVDEVPIQQDITPVQQDITPVQQETAPVLSDEKLSKQDDAVIQLDETSGLDESKNQLDYDYETATDDDYDYFK